jgi:hypothetical protein
MRLFQREKGGKRQGKISYDPEKMEPAVRSSICTGEMVAGLRDRQSGKFDEITLVKNQQELDEFCKACGISPDKIVKFY